MRLTGRPKSRPQEESVTSQRSIDTLGKMIRGADFDGALKYVDKFDLVGRTLKGRFNQPYESLKGKCLLCEVLDYAGRYDDCIRLLRSLRDDLAKDGKTPQLVERLTYFCDESQSLNGPLRHAPQIKQEAWICLHLGMIAYRANDYPAATSCFRVSERVFLTLHDRKTRSYGSLARAKYCLGLVARQEHQYDEARRYFAESIEYAWEGRPSDESLPGHLFNIARCLSLGLAWIAYTRAALAEATGLIIASRLLLSNTRAKYIDAYVEVVHACTLMSARGDEIEILDNGIAILKHSLRSLGGPVDTLQVVARNGKGLADLSDGNGTYALRCIAEMAHAFQRRARYYQQKGKNSPSAQNIRRRSAIANENSIVRFSAEKENSLKCASDCIKIIKDSVKLGNKCLYQHEIRTYCSALVTESRLERIKGNIPESLQLAQLAKTVASGLKSMPRGFVYLDCLASLGEAQHYAGAYDKAIASFEEVRRDPRTATNPKRLSACDLHLAHSCLAAHRHTEAQRHFQAWDNSGRRGMENSFIRAFGAEIEGLLRAAMTPFGIDATRGRLNYDRCWKELRWWLATTALNLNDGDTVTAAADLDVDEITLRNWINKYWEKRKKKGTTRRDGHSTIG